MPPQQACSQTVNTSGALAYDVGAFMYIHLYMYLMLVYITAYVCMYVCVYMYIYYVCMSVQSASVGTTESTLYLHKVLCDIAQNIFHIHAFLRMGSL